LDFVGTDEVSLLPCWIVLAFASANPQFEGLRKSCILGRISQIAMTPSLTEVSDFDTLYLLPREVGKTKRRTREWTIPRLREAGINSGRILSVGCGNGADLITLRSNGYEAFGIDLYEPIPDAKQWFSKCTAQNIPHEDASFDAIVCLEVIEHIPRAGRKTAAAEMLRVLKQDSPIILATPNRLFPVDEHAAFLRIHSPFKDDTLSTSEIEALFERSARPLTWRNYFAFQRFGAAGRLISFLTWPFDNSILHRSPLNPHLFLELR
jgi:SAM-dependent methyltransferase